VPELVRGKAGRVFGHLHALLTIMKGLPLAYNRDLQEDKRPLFDTVDTVKGCLEAFAALAAGLQVKGERMAAAVVDGFMNATDLADYLVARGVPFRSAHEVVGNIVRSCAERGLNIEHLPLTELKRFSSKIEKDVYPYLSARAGVERRRSEGGTAPANVKRRLKELGV